MRRFLVLALFLGLCTLPGVGQKPEVDRTPDQSPLNSPSRLLKQQHEELKKLTSRMVQLSTEVEEDLDKGGENVLPLNTLKKLDEIEKLARKIRSRMKQ